MGLGPKVKTTGGGAAKPFASDFIDWLGTNTTSSGGFNTAIGRLLSGQGLSDNGNQAYDTAYNKAMGGIGQVGLDPNSQFAQGINTMLQQRQTQAQNDLRARFGAQGGMAFGTPAATAEARYLAESTPQIAATLGQYDLQKRGVDLQTLLGLMGAQSQRSQFNNAQGSQLIQQLLGLGGNAMQIGTPQAQTMVQPGLLQQIGGIASGVASVANPFGGLMNLIGGKGLPGMPNINPYVLQDANSFGASLGGR